jgi:hypothetical protein
MVRVPVRFFPIVKSVLDSIAFTNRVDVFKSDTFDWDAFMVDALI